MPSVVTWVNQSGGSWSVASNWSAGRLPGVGDEVVINVPGNVTVTHSGGNDSIHSLTSSDNLVVSGGSLTLEAASTLNSTTTLSGGTLTTLGTLTLNDLFTWTGGTLSGRGHTEADGGLAITGSNGKTLSGGTLDNAGTATWSGTGGISLGSNAVLNNLASGSLTITGDATMSGGSTTFNNAGSLTKSAGTGTTAFNLHFNNTSTGTVDVASGTLALGNGGVSDGAFTVESGAKLTFSGGNDTLKSDSTLGGNGNVAFTNGNTSILGQYAVGGDTGVAGGTVSFVSAASTTTLTQSGGTLSGGGDLTVTGLLTWTGGTMNGGGITDAAGGISLSGNDGKSLSNRTLNNAGTATWTGTGDVALGGSAAWNNLAGSTLDIQNDRTFGGGSSTFNNAGTLKKSAGTNTTTFNTYLNNTGTVDIASGTVTFNGGGSGIGTYTAEAGAILAFGGGTQSLQAGSSVSGGGRVSFTGGTTTVRGTYNVSGDTSLSGGTVDFEGTVSLNTLTLSGGTLTGAGDVVVSGLLTWTGGTMSGGGTTDANGGVSISGSNGKTLSDRTFNNAATATWTGTGGVSFSGGATWNNLAGATLDIQTDATFGSSPATINNAGTIQKSAGTGTTAINASLNNSGTVDIASGTVSLNNGGTGVGTYTAEAGATLTFGGGTQTLRSGSSVSGGGTVKFTNGTTTVSGSYNVSGDTTVTGGTVFFESNVSLGTLTQSGGTLSGAGDVAVSGLLTWTGGTMNGGGTTDAAGGMAISGGNDKVLTDRTLNNAGAATWTGTGWLQIINNAVFNNLSGATVDAQSDAPFGSQSIFTAEGTWNNAGTFRKSAGSSTGQTYGYLYFNNTGTVDAAAGTLDLDGGGVSSGSFVTEQGAFLKFGGGTHTLTANSSVTGAGNVVFDSETFNNEFVTINGTYNVTGTTIFQASSGFTSPNVRFESNVTMGALNLATGTLTGDGDVTVTGALTWTGGTLSGNGQANAQGGLVISGSNGKTLDGRTLNNFASATWSGTGNVSAVNGAAFNNLSGATFNDQADATFGDNSTTFNNAGTFTKSGDNGGSTFNSYFLNTGTLEVATGTLLLGNDFTSSGTVTIDAGAFLTVTGTYIQSGGSTTVSGALSVNGQRLLDLQAGTLGGSGMINCDVVNAGQVNPGGDGTAGALTINGGYTQTSSGVLSIDLGGTTQGTQYDALKVNGAVTLDGTLQVNLINGYSPAPGDSFQVLTFNARTGDFAAEHFPSLGGLVLSPVYHSGDLTLVTQTA